MVRHNNEIPNQHFHKKWANASRGPLKVKSWFNQPIQKKRRREKRQEKASAAAPAPVSGSLRPLVQCPTRKVSKRWCPTAGRAMPVPACVHQPR